MRVTTLSRLARFTAMLLIPALLINSLAFASSKPADPAVMKARVQARGVGQGVRVMLADNTQVKGLVVSIGEESFALKPTGSDQPLDIRYTQVIGVHSDKLSVGQKTGIVVGIVAAAVAITAIVIVVIIKTHPIRVGI